MRRIEQPGLPAPHRIQWVEARGRNFSFLLEAGIPLLEAARRGFAAKGFVSGTLNIKGGALGPFAYVMPALSKTGEHAAFYGETLRPEGESWLKQATMTLGERDGDPFFHCHGVWLEAYCRVNGGHVLPEETIVAKPFEVEAFGLDGVVFKSEPDAETNFKLFGPVAEEGRGIEATCRAFALRLRPNQDLASGLENFCREHGIARARIRGGVGSTIGARFTDGRLVEPFATELTVTSGLIACNASGAPEALLDVQLVDYTGGLAEGRLVRGDNPVLMTMELVLEVLS
jgi:predicted DNA-binding protein with PD1-like motif